MAEEPNQDNQDQAAESSAPTPDRPSTPSKMAWWRGFSTRKWVVILVVGSVVLHAIGFTYSRLAGRTPPNSGTPEVSLGVFRFEADKDEAGRVTAAEFSLHIALLEQVDQAARGQLEAHRLRVQQGVEELLRQAHGGDFDDPDLGELKRRLQEQINETLGMRAIADVIITDLKLQHNDRNREALTDSGDLVPWVEKPSG